MPFLREDVNLNMTPALFDINERLASVNVYLYISLHASLIPRDSSSIYSTAEMDVSQYILVLDKHRDEQVERTHHGV